MTTKPSILLKRASNSKETTITIPDSQIKSSPNSPFNIYQIANNIGISKKYLDRGTYGVVYLITDLRTGKKCIVKEILIPPSIVSRPDRLRFFNNIQREIGTQELLSSVDQAICPKYYGHYNISNGVAIVMEHITGENLEDFINSSEYRLLPENSKLAIIMVISTKLLKMIKIMHDLNIVHRDLKLKNIMVDYHDSTIKMVNILDYGFACSNTGLSLKLGNCAPLSVGTPLFMAPQLFDGSTIQPEYDFNTLKLVDIWSFGIILYILVSKSTKVEPVPLAIGSHSYDDLLKFIKQMLLFGDKWVNFTIFGHIFSYIFRDYHQRASVDFLISEFAKLRTSENSDFGKL